jgi:hypothetical protein
VYEFAQERNLPVTTVVKIYAVRHAAEDQAGQVKSDKSLSPEQQATALAVLKTTTTETISSALGNAYHEYLEGPGHWLEDLAPPPEPKEPGKGP